jgi:transposase
MRPKGTPQELERRRRRAATLLREGRGVSEVAFIVGASPGTVSTWKKKLAAGGDAALDAKPHPGPAPRLKWGQKQRLLEMLAMGATHHGWINDLWTLGRVAALIRRKFGVTYDPSGVWHILRGLKWSAQKPEQRAREADEAAIAHWRRHRWPRLKKSARVRQGHCVHR